MIGLFEEHKKLTPRLEIGLEFSHSQKNYASCNVYMQTLQHIQELCLPIVNHSKHRLPTSQKYSKKCKNVQVVVDSYSSGGIKSNGRWCWGNQHQIKRGAGERYVLLNIDIKVPYDLDN